MEVISIRTDGLEVSVWFAPKSMAYSKYPNLITGAGVEILEKDTRFGYFARFGFA